MAPFMPRLIRPLGTVPTRTASRLVLSFPLVLIGVIFAGQAFAQNGFPNEPPPPGALRANGRHVGAQPNNPYLQRPAPALDNVRPPDFGAQESDLSNLPGPPTVSGVDPGPSAPRRGLPAI